MLLIGLTGSIATGKSTVSSILAAPPHSLPIVDADVLARQVVEPGTPGYRQIVRRFSASTPDLLEPPSDTMPERGPRGWGRPLNRAALGRRVFGPGDERARDRRALNKIVHPAVRRAMAMAVARCYLTGHWAVVLDVPLLLEGGLDRACGTLLVVAVTDPDVQLRRLLARDHRLTLREAQYRIDAQADLRVKTSRCHARGPYRGFVLWNDGSPADLPHALDRTLAQLHRRHPLWWTWLLLALPPLALLAALVALCRNLWAEFRLEPVDARSGAKSANEEPR